MGSIAATRVSSERREREMVALELRVEQLLRILEAVEVRLRRLETEHIDYGVRPLR